ncbi:MAG: hypothetical protein IJB09_04150 [Oscillospiraceae bacterium]|nr:hypothetical protein [Oscillospiraceae bacterium]
MKRNLVFIVLSLVIAASLCGCADTMVDDGIKVTSTPAVTSTPVITSMPKVSPKADDGDVNDTDGIIGDEDREEKKDGVSVTNKPSSNVDETEGAKVNTQPKVSAAPSATVKP